MKKTILLLTLLLSLALTACGSGMTEGGQRVALFAANVGKGDALILRVDDWCGLIDAGKPQRMGRVRKALEAMGVARLDAVFLTHTDKDHGGGLQWLAESDIPVGAWYASGLYTGVKEKKHPAVKAAATRGQSVTWLRRGDVVTLGDTGAALRALAPDRLFEDKDDNNSLVLLLQTAQGRMLLTGDMELPEEAALLAAGDDLSCAVLKVPNHADDDTVSQALADACQAQVAVISTDGQEKPGTPDPGVLARLNAVGTACYSTEDAGLGLRVELSGGHAEVTAQPLAAASRNDLYIDSVVPGEDRIVLSNPGEPCDMTGWYLHSDAGDELFTFPDGYVLPAGASVTVGSRSTDGDFDLLWDDKKVVHAGKTDAFTLYDPWGNVVDTRDNGL